MDKLKTIKQTIGIFPNALSSDICEELIAKFEKFYRLDKTSIGHTLGGIDKSVKDTQDLDLLHKDILDGDKDVSFYNTLISKVSNDLVVKHLKSFGDESKWDPLEIFQDGSRYDSWLLQRYRKNTGHYDAWHTEQPYRLPNCHRLMVCMFYLNDV